MGKESITRGVDVLERTDQEIKPPRRYTVILLNDHFTTQEFVVWVLVEVFQLTQEEAFKTMMDVHKKGRGTVGRTYTKDIAETKAKQTQDLARANEYPLKCTVEPVD